MSKPIDISNIKNKNEQYLFIKKHVNDIVSKLHNPSIIDPNLQPNGNIIYSLYAYLKKYKCLTVICYL